MTASTLEMRPVPTPDALHRASESDLVAMARDFAAISRHGAAGGAAVAGELARRSDPELGYDGLAARSGARTVEKLVVELTGTSVNDARDMVAVGTMGKSPWLDEVVASVQTGSISVAAAAAIGVGLGTPNGDIDEESLRSAAEKLAHDAETSSPEALARAARLARDELDAAGVADREADLRAKRSFRMWPRRDGMTGISGALDPYSAAVVRDAYDRITMPKRGGVRFLDPLELERRDQAKNDSRTIDQIAADGFVEAIRKAALVDDGKLFGSKAPAVRLHVRLSDVKAGTGAAYAEGVGGGISVGTVHKLICDGGIVPILFDDNGEALRVGRTQRLFTKRQRIAIAARDGGCMAPGCDRPASWTEAHHCTEVENGGLTDIDNGIALCTHHHLWLHNTGRYITHVRGRFFLHHGNGLPPEELFSKHPLRQRSPERVT